MFRSSGSVELSAFMHARLTAQWLAVAFGIVFACVAASEGATTLNPQRMLSADEAVLPPNQLYSTHLFDFERATKIELTDWTVAASLLILHQAIIEAPKLDKNDEPAKTAEEPIIAAQPFGLSTHPASDLDVLIKWKNLERDIQAEAEILSQCRSDILGCRSPAALRFLAIVESAQKRTGRARIGELNRAINLAIRPVSDLAQHNIQDLWSAPLATFTSGKGDCEDYAIAKYIALRESGIANEDLELVIFRDLDNQIDHAVILVREAGRWLVLDNRMHVILDDMKIKNWLPLFALNQSGVRRFAMSAPAQIAAFAGGLNNTVSANHRAQSNYRITNAVAAY